MPHVYTGGTFDLFHAGHVRLLQRCQTLADGDTVTVALNTDKFVAEHKGRPPVHTYKQRAAILSACRHVDHVIPNTAGSDSKPSLAQWRAVLPDGVGLIVAGSDWATVGSGYYRQLSVDDAWLDHMRLMVVYVPYTAGVSTTAIRDRIADG